MSIFDSKQATSFPLGDLGALWRLGAIHITKVEHAHRDMGVLAHA